MARMIHLVAGSEDSGPRARILDGAGRVRRDEEQSMAQARKSADRFRRLTLGAPVRRLLLRSALAFAVVVAGAFSIAFIDANWRFAQKGPAAPIRLYSAP